MSDETFEQQLTEKLLMFGKMMTKASIIIDGNIDSVDESTFTCAVDIQSNNSDGSLRHTIYENVPLKVLIGSQASFVEIPTIGSACTMTFKDNNIQRPELLQVQDCDKILCRLKGSEQDGSKDIILTITKLDFTFNAAGQTLKISKDGFVFNNASHGAVKADELKTQSNKDKDILDGFLQALQTPVNEPGNGAPSAFQAALLAALGTKQSGTWDNLESDKIKIE